MNSAHGKPAIILVVDDEITDAEFMSFALASEGHTVRTAVTAEEALRAHGELGTSLDLLITDIAMPVTSGVELAKAMQAQQPWLKVLFVSGYPGIEVLRYQWIRDATTHFLRKPFSAETLVQAVRRVLATESRLSGSSSGAAGEG